uniref:RING-type domain-containing protein n=1 Tax=Macaca nemestrina TaxID=9545 RepID=A0A2K6E5G9_MACNE
MNSGILQVFQRELTCPICMNYFIDPVTIDCGHTFCRPCFYLNWQDIALLAQCSECRKITQQKNLKTDIHVKKMASLAKKASLWQFLSSEEQMCGTHREIKKMFCDVVKSLLCLLCSSSQEHRDHRHCPIEWAEKLLKEMQSLWEKACENHRNLNVETTRTRCWKVTFGDILHRYESLLLQVLQPVNPELSAGPITGLLDRLNGFRGECQPIGGIPSMYYCLLQSYG